METKENRVTLTVEQAIDAVCAAASELDWNPCHEGFVKAGGGDESGSGSYFDFENWTPLGQNFFTAAVMVEADIGSLLDNLDTEAEEFDADEETKFYVREDMLGRSGVPHSLEAVLNDLKDRKTMLLDFAKGMRLKLEHLTEVENQNQN